MDCQKLKQVTINPIRCSFIILAKAVLKINLYFAQVNTEPRTLADLNQEELQTYDQAMEALALLSSNFKKSTDNISAINLVSESLNQGQENLAYLGEFDNTTDRIINYK